MLEVIISLSRSYFLKYSVYQFVDIVVLMMFIPGYFPPESAVKIG